MHHGPIHYGEFLRVCADGDTFEEMVAQAIVKLANRIEPGEQILRRCPKRLSHWAWVVSRVDCEVSFGGNRVEGCVVFELVYPEDLEDD